MMTPTTRFESHPMRTIAFTSFPRDEQDDFRFSCRRWRRNPDEFTVKAEENDPPPGSAMPMRREVIVVYSPTGKGRRYSAGGGTNWILTFSDDLQAVYFGR
jgi:hypothetical protein